MKTFGILLLLVSFSSLVSAQNLKPYIVGFETSESITDIKEKVIANLESNEIKILGQYQPALDKNRWVIVISSPELVNAVKNIGGFAGFAASLRVGITTENGKTVVSYTNPAYWGNAYFRGDFDKVSSNYAILTTHLENAMKASGTYSGKDFGSEKGLTIKNLRKYHYMIGMPYFDDQVELADLGNYQKALAKIESNITKGIPDLKMVYKIEIPDKELTLFGFALSGEKGESKFLPTIDINNPKHTAFLPYEVLIIGGKVHILHGRYRIAISFPDLTMGTFSKIMATPGNIENLLKQVVK